MFFIMFCSRHFKDGNIYKKKHKKKLRNILDILQRRTEKLLAQRDTKLKVPSDRTEIDDYSQPGFFRENFYFFPSPAAASYSHPVTSFAWFLLCLVLVGEEGQEGLYSVTNGVAWLVAVAVHCMIHHQHKHSQQTSLLTPHNQPGQAGIFFLF